MAGVPPPEGPAIAIVGARAASQLAVDRAAQLATHAARRGVHVVSGGAIGVDGAAHRGALLGGGTTTVVLGSALDVVYPRRHAHLFREVVARGGGLISALPAGTQPRRFTFLQRNPLIAALADAVVVVEADVRSGSLVTAAAGKQLGRVVAAWPGSPGCDRLLRAGAAVIESCDDLDRVLAGNPRSYQPTNVSDPAALRVRDAIAAGARGADQIVERTGLPVLAVMRALTLLERMTP